MNFDFTTTAMDRPEILQRTYDSFKKNMDIDFRNHRLFINIDEVNNKSEETLKIAQTFFGNVVFNVSKNPNFTSAVNWCWSKAESDIIFHLEDDWLLIEPIKIYKVLKSFKNSKVNQIALRAYEYNYDTYVLSPSFISSKLYKKVANKLDTKLNPEIQLRGFNFGIKMPSDKNNNDKIVVYSNKPILKDIGRDWLNKTPFKRPDKKANFTKWEIK